MSTSAKSKSSKPRKAAAGSLPQVDRPFTASVLRRASTIASKYHVILWMEDGEWFGSSLELPGAAGDGARPEDCVAMVRESMTALVALALELGQQPPQPAKMPNHPEAA
jgi:predicted RNase H-like HicB family nuclease